MGVPHIARRWSWSPAPFCYYSSNSTYWEQAIEAEEGKIKQERKKRALTIRRLGGPSLKRNRVTGHSSKMMIPQPLHRLLVPRHPYKLMTLLRALDLLLLIRTLVPLHPPAPDNQHIARLELHALLSRDLLDHLDRDLMSLGSLVLDPMPLRVRGVIDQDAPRNDAAALGPVVLAIVVDVGRLSDGGVGEVVVVEAGLLVAPVPEAVPLGPGLRVDVDEVVPGEEAEGVQVLEGVG